MTGTCTTGTCTTGTCANRIGTLLGMIPGRQPRTETSPAGKQAFNHRCTRTGMSPACRFATARALLTMARRANPLAPVPSVCIRVHLWLKILACRPRVPCRGTRRSAAVLHPVSPTRRPSQRKRNETTMRFAATRTTPAARDRRAPPRRAPPRIDGAQPPHRKRTETPVRLAASNPRQNAEPALTRPARAGAWGRNPRIQAETRPSAPPLREGRCAASLLPPFTFH